MTVLNISGLTDRARIGSRRGCASGTSAFDVSLCATVNLELCEFLSYDVPEVASAFRMQLFWNSKSHIPIPWTAFLMHSIVESEFSLLREALFLGASAIETSINPLPLRNFRIALAAVDRGNPG